LKKRSITWSCSNDKEEVHFLYSTFLIFSSKVLSF
jgi:hypothetical protein